MNKHVRHLAPFALFALVVVGCSKPSTSVSPPGSTGASDTKATSGGTNSSDKPSVASIPADLKNDAFAYSGLGRDKPKTYLFSQVGGSQPQEGTETTELKSIAKDGATFTVTRTGSLASLGSEEELIQSDGLYLLSTSLGSPPKPARVLPAKMAVGDTWNYDYVLKNEGQPDISFKGTGKALQVEKIKVPAGEFDALVVSDTVVMDKGQGKETVSSKTWYAKDIGVVKFKLEVKGKDNKVLTSSVELSKVGE